MRMTVLGAMALLGATMVMVGCSSSARQNDPMAVNTGAMDVSPVPTPLAVEPVPAPVAQPIVSDGPTQVVAAPVAAPVAAEPVTSSGGAKYVVQKGDTLWKIATTSYGDGKQWQRIVAANPGVSPSTLKAGQTITIP